MYSQFSITTLVVGLLMPLLATVAVALRLRARRIKKQVLGLDDYAVAFALVSINGMSYMTISDCSRLVPLGWESWPSGVA